MDSATHRAARAHEQAHDAVEAARAARERSEQIRLEMGLRRGRGRTAPVDVDPWTEAVLRAHLLAPRAVSRRGGGTPAPTGPDVGPP